MKAVVFAGNRDEAIKQLRIKIIRLGFIYEIVDY
jgi:hypothetical protein